MNPKGGETMSESDLFDKTIDKGREANDKMALSQSAYINGDLQLSKDRAH